MKTRRVLKGTPRVEKVDCQACGQVKELGIKCELCGWPQIELRLAQDGRLLIFLPLCPSTNDRQSVARMGRYSRLVLTSDARDYIASVKNQLRPLLDQAIREWNWEPVTTWKIVWTWMILPRTSCDPHNYWKISLDALEASGAFFDDRYAITRLGGIHFNSKEPGMVFKI